MNRIERHEDLTYTELKNAIRRAQALVKQTEEWADAWHLGESGRAPFNVAGLFYGGDLTDLGLRAQAYHAAAQAKGEQEPVFTVDGLTPGDHETTCRVFALEQDAHEFAQERTGQSRPVDPTADYPAVYDDGTGGVYTVRQQEV